MSVKTVFHKYILGEDPDGKLENTGDLTVIDVPLTLSAAYRSVELALGVDYIGIEEIKELAKEKERL